MSIIQDGKLAEMIGVRELGENYPVELWRIDGRLVVRAFNQCKRDATDVDAEQLLAWLTTHLPTHAFEQRS